MLNGQKADGGQRVIRQIFPLHSPNPRRPPPAWQQGHVMVLLRERKPGARPAASSESEESEEVRFILSFFQY